MNPNASPLTDEIVGINLDQDKKILFVKTAKRSIVFQMKIDPTDPALVRFKNQGLGLDITLDDVLEWLDR